MMCVFFLSNETGTKEEEMQKSILPTMCVFCQFFFNLKYFYQTRDRDHK